MKKEVVVVVDDNPDTIDKVKKALYDVHGKKNIVVKTALNQKDGQQVISAMLDKSQMPDRVISDLSMGKLYQPAGKLAGYHLCKWCVEKGVPADRIILHSTAFNKGNGWERLHKATTVKWATKLGIKTQGKEVLLGKKRKHMRG